MRISFSPQRRDDTLTLEKTGDRLRINGALFNFSPLADGDTVPAGEVPCEWIVGPIERVDGEIHLTLILPHGPIPSQAVAFPEPITITEDGPIAVPHDPAREPEPANVDA
jgi:hypothetical protein